MKNEAYMLTKLRKFILKNRCRKASCIELGISETTLCNVFQGTRTLPPRALKKLGLIRVTAYEDLKQ